MSDFTQEQFEHELEDNDVKALQIIYGALAMGVIVFLAVIIGIYLNTDVSPAEGEDFIRTLTMAHFAMLAMALVASKVLYQQVLSRSLNIADSAAALFGAFRTSHIIRLALFEGAAFLGLVVCFVAAKSGVLQANAFYWVNITSAIVMIAMIAIYFPSRESILNEFRQFSSHG